MWTWNQFLLMIWLLSLSLNSALILIKPTYLSLQSQLQYPQRVQRQSLKTKLAYLNSKHHIDNSSQWSLIEFLLNICTQIDSQMMLLKLVQLALSFEKWWMENLHRPLNLLQEHLIHTLQLAKMANKSAKLDSRFISKT